MTEHGQPEPRRAGRITDARGRRVTQLDPVTLRLLRSRGSIPPEQLREIAGAIGLGWRRYVWWGRIVLVGVWVFLLAQIIRLLAFRLSKPGPVTVTDIGVAAAVVASVVFPAWSLWLGLRRNRTERTCWFMLSCRRCPHCGYDIRGLPTDYEDGATVCPECGCAWRLPEGPETGDQTRD